MRTNRTIPKHVQILFHRTFVICFSELCNIKPNIIELKPQPNEAAIERWWIMNSCICRYDHDDHMNIGNTKTLIQLYDLDAHCDLLNLKLRLN